MSIKYQGRKLRWKGVAKRVKRKHPSWSTDRVNAYVAGIEAKQKGE